MVSSAVLMFLYMSSFQYMQGEEGLADVIYIHGMLWRANQGEVHCTIFGKARSEATDGPTCLASYVVLSGSLSVADYS